jgi:hypothetical protein
MEDTMIGSIMVTTNRNRLVKRNALAIVAAYGLTTLHHIYGGLVDDAPNRLTVPMIMAVPTVAALVALHRYERTGSKTALATAATVTPLDAKRTEARRDKVTAQRHLAEALTRQPDAVKALAEAAGGSMPTARNLAEDSRTATSRRQGGTGSRFVH